MASRKALLIAAAMAVVVAVALLPATASAAAYKVGDDFGWNTGMNYDAWAKGKNFKVGDTLEFVYQTEKATHNDVVLVDEEASYKACTVPSNAPTLTSGDDVVTLCQAGPWFFICGVKGQCQAGMKLAVDVK